MFSVIAEIETRFQVAGVMYRQLPLRYVRQLIILPSLEQRDQELVRYSHPWHRQKENLELSL